MAGFRSVTMAGLASLMAAAPWAGVARAQPVYQPTQQQQSDQPPPNDQPQPGAQPQQPQAPAPQPGDQSGQPGQQQGAPTPYTTAQLDQMLAPVALYPDTLLSDVLMASTYPIQLVEAQRWLSNPHNAAIHGDALVTALQPMTWDPSVKSLVPFPQIIKQMNDQLDWTQSLGTAFAYQQADVMERVQALRHQSEDCGKLASTPKMKVAHDGPAITIAPADPAVVYVPVYNPAVVYGTWAYAAYPPFYFAPPPGFYIGAVGLDIGFSVGFGIVDPLWGWGYPVWGSHSIFVNNAYYSRISYNHAGFAGGAWHHEGPVGFHGGGFRGGAAGFHGGAAGFHGGAAGRSFAGARGGAAHAAARGTGHAAASHGGARGFGGGHSFAGGSHGAARATSHAAGGYGGAHGGGGRAVSHGASFHGGGGAHGGGAPRGGGGHSASRGGGHHR
jgi:hypothetical protein